MHGGSINSTSVYISTVPTGCLKVEFDSTYPIRLNGIISRDDFRESINRINRTISSNRDSLSFIIIFGLSIVVGMAFIITAVAIQDTSSTNRFPPLTGVGVGVLVGGPIFSLIGLCIIQFRRTVRLRQAIAEESMKYSSRLPMSCNWRLQIVTNFFGEYEDDHNSRMIYFLVIDIERVTTSRSTPCFPNKVATESTLLLRSPDDEAPPSYSSLSTGFCSQCGTLQQGLSSNFCSSCGYSFNRRALYW